jgi:hypothetical protein
MQPYNLEDMAAALTLDIRIPKLVATIRADILIPQCHTPAG